MTDDGTMSVPPPADPDSPQKFCADFAAVRSMSGMSYRKLEASTGWGKSTIESAGKGTVLPNVDLVNDVLVAIGKTQETCDQWRERHIRLSAPRKGASLPGPAPEPAPGVGLDVESTQLDEGTNVERVPTLEAEPAGRRGWGTWVLVGVLVVAAAVVAWSLLAGGDSTTAGRTIVVQNKVATGPSELVEDDSPSYLAARPIPRCANVPGCKLEGTDLESGDTVRAVCVLQGAPLTNADATSPGIRENPNIAASSLWYGITWRDGRRGYLSEVYVAATYRGGLGLTPC